MKIQKINAKIEKEIYQKYLIDNLNSKKISKYIEDKYTVDCSNAFVSKLIKELKSSNKILITEATKTKTDLNIESLFEYTKIMIYRIKNNYIKSKHDTNLQKKFIREIKCYIELYCKIKSKIDKEKDLQNYINLFVPKTK